MRRWVPIIVFATLLTLNSAGVDKGSDVERSDNDDDYVNDSTDENDDPVPVTKPSNPNTTKERWKARRATVEKKTKQKIWKDIRREVRDMKNNVLPGLTGNISWMEVDVRDMNGHLFSMVGDVRFIKNEVLYIKRQAHVIWENVTDTRRDHKRMNKTLWMILNNVTLILNDVQKTAGYMTNMQQKYGTIGDKLADAVDKVVEVTGVTSTLRNMNMELGEMKTMCTRSNIEVTDELSLVREIISKLGRTILDIKDYVTKGFPQVDQHIGYLGGMQSRILSNVTTVSMKVDQQSTIMSTIANTLYDVSNGIYAYTEKIFNIWNLAISLDEVLKKVDKNIITVNDHLEYFSDRVAELDHRVDDIQESIHNITTQTSKLGIQIGDISNNINHHFYSTNINLGNVHDRIITNVSIVKNDLDEIKGQLTEIRDVIAEKCEAKKCPSSELDNGIVEIHDNEVPDDVSSSGRPDWPEESTVFPENTPPNAHPSGYPSNGAGLPATPVDSGHPHPGGVSPQNGLPPQNGFPSQNGLPSQNGFPPQNGLPPQNGFLPQNQRPTWPPTQTPTWHPVPNYPTTYPPTALPGYPSVYPPIVPTPPPAYPHPPITIYPPLYPIVAYPHVPSSLYPPTVTGYPTTVLPPSYPLPPIAPIPAYPPASPFPPIPVYPGSVPTGVTDDHESPSTTPSPSRPLDPQVPSESGAPIGIPFGLAGPGLPIGSGAQFTGHCSCICPCDCACPTIERKAIAKPNRYDQFSDYWPTVDCFCLCSCPCPESITNQQINGLGNGEKPSRPTVPPFEPPPVPLPPSLLPPAPIPSHIPAVPATPGPVYPGWRPPLDEGMCLNAFNQVLRECAQMRQEMVRMANITALEHELTRRIVIDEIARRFDYIQPYIHAHMDNIAKLSVQFIDMMRALQNQIERAKEGAILSLEIVARNIVNLHRQLAGQWTGSPIPASPMSDRQPTYLPIPAPQPGITPGFQVLTPPGQAPSYVPSRPQTQSEGRPQLMSPNHLPAQPAPYPTGFPPELQSPMFSTQPIERPIPQLIGRPDNSLEELLDKLSPGGQKPESPTQSPNWLSAERHNFSYGLAQPPGRPDNSLEELLDKLSPGGQKPESPTQSPSWFSAERHNFSYGLAQPPTEDSQLMMGRKHTGETVTNTTQMSTSSEVAQRMFPSNEKSEESMINASTTAGKSKRKSRKGCATKRKYVGTNKDLPMPGVKLVYPSNENEVDSEAYDKDVQEGLLYDVGNISDGAIDMPNTEMPLSERALRTIQAPIDPFAFHNLLQDQINHQLMNARRPGLPHRSKRKRLSPDRWRGRPRIRYKNRPRPMFPVIPGFPFIRRPRIPQVALPNPIVIKPPRIPNIFDHHPPGIMTAGINGSPYSISYNDGKGSSWNVNVNRRHNSNMKHEDNSIESNEDDEVEDPIKARQNEDDANITKDTSGATEQR